MHKNAIETSLFSIFWKKNHLEFLFTVLLLQKECPSARTSLMTMEWLKNRFPETLISKMSDSTSPTSSPDLNRLNFCLLGNTKEEIHQAWPDSITEIKERIQNFIVSRCLSLMISAATADRPICVSQNMVLWGSCRGVWGASWPYKTKLTALLFRLIPVSLSYDKN